MTLSAAGSRPSCVAARPQGLRPSGLPLLTVGGICLAVLLGLAGGHQGVTQGRQADAELTARIRAFVARTIVLVPLDEVSILELNAPDAGGLRKVVLQVGEGEAPVREVIYITANGREVVEGTVAPLVADPWAETRDKLAPIVGTAPVVGPTSAPVTIVEFSDFECPYCGQLNAGLWQLRATLPHTLQWVFLNFPLTAIHPWAMSAAISGVCVAQQGAPAFWTFEHGVYENQSQISPSAAAAQLRSLAKRSGVDPNRYEECLRSGGAVDRVQSEMSAGKALGVSGTPTLFLNGRELPGAVSVDALKAAIANEIALRDSHLQK